MHSVAKAFIITIVWLSQTFLAYWVIQAFLANEKLGPAANMYLAKPPGNRGVSSFSIIHGLQSPTALNWIGDQGMRLQTPPWLDYLIERVESNQFLSWAGLLLTIAGIVGASVAHSFIWAAVLILVALVIGALIGWGFTRSKSPIRCVSCIEEYELSGARGTQATCKSTMKFVFKKYTEGFTFGIKRSTGPIVKERFFYRYLGHHCKDGNAAQREFGAGDLNHGPQLVEGHKTYIRLPAPARINDYYEIVRAYSLTDSFPADNEEAGKFILYHCKLLKIKIIFKGCQPTNVLGYGSKDYVPIPGSQTPLDLHPDGAGANMVEWDVENAEPGQRYTVQWVWG